jgi:hypothetical protein
MEDQSTFEGVAETIFTWTKVHMKSYFINLQLAPHGIVKSASPLAGNSIGHDLLNPCLPFPYPITNTTNPVLCPTQCGDSLSGRFCFPDRRESALNTIKLKQITLTGPLALAQGGSAYLAQIPIYINGSSTNYNATIDRGYGPHDCEPCFNAITGERFWGFANLLIDFSLLLSEVVQIDRKMEEAELWFAMVNNINQTIAASSDIDENIFFNVKGLAETETFPIKVLNVEYTLFVAPRGNSWFHSSHKPDAQEVITIIIIIIIITNMLMPVQLNSFTYLRVLLVLNGRGGSSPPATQRSVFRQ